MFFRLSYCNIEKRKLSFFSNASICDKNVLFELSIIQAYSNECHLFRVGFFYFSKSILFSSFTAFFMLFLCPKSILDSFNRLQQKNSKFEQKYFKDTIQKNSGSFYVGPFPSSKHYEIILLQYCVKSYKIAYYLYKETESIMDKICIRHLEFPCLHNNFFMARQGSGSKFIDSISIQ